jgi:tetratricopeptide (TPR) repeat protein
MGLLSTNPSSHTAALLLAAFVMVLLAACTAEQSESIGSDESINMGKLGAVEFPTSAQSAKAQARFLRGVAALHSFWYPVALDEFRESTKIEPDFMMGYWGEAMAHNHPIWGDPQETDAARQVLEKIKDTPKLTQRERAWLNAVKVLYGEGDKPARDRAYSAAMERIYRDYPDDAEAALFYALSLLGTVNPEDPAGLQTRLRAGEIASEVYQKNPSHPGAAHYVIHAYDDPENAARALNAAHRYAEIAPEAPHALHMPSHIFLQLGMWPEAAGSNEASWAASDK